MFWQVRTKSGVSRRRLWDPTQKLCAWRAAVACRSSLGAAQHSCEAHKSKGEYSFKTGQPRLILLGLPESSGDSLESLIGEARVVTLQTASTLKLLQEPLSSQRPLLEPLVQLLQVLPLDACMNDAVLDFLFKRGRRAHKNAEGGI